MSRASNRKHAQRQRPRDAASVPVARHRALYGELLDTEDALAYLVLAGPELLGEWASQTQRLLDRIYESGAGADLHPCEPVMLLGWAARMVLTRIAETGTTDLEEWLSQLTKDRNLHADHIAHAEALRAFRSRAWEGLR